MKSILNYFTGWNSNSELSLHRNTNSVFGFLRNELIDPKSVKYSIKICEKTPNFTLLLPDPGQSVKKIKY